MPIHCRPSNIGFYRFHPLELLLKRITRCFLDARRTDQLITDPTAPTKVLKRFLGANMDNVLAMPACESIGLTFHSFRACQCRVAAYPSNCHLFTTSNMK